MIPDIDAAFAEKLAAAGTVLMGKLTTHEFADGGPSFDLPAPPAAYEEWSRTRLGGFSEGMRTRLMRGTLVSGVYYVQAVRRRREFRAELQAAMAGLDVVLTAT